jgi:hypothetical protein
MYFSGQHLAHDPYTQHPVSLQGFDLPKYGARSDALPVPTPVTDDAELFIPNPMTPPTCACKIYGFVLKHCPS